MPCRIPIPANRNDVSAGAGKADRLRCGNQAMLPSDRELAESAGALLNGDPLVSARSLVVSVKHRMVILGGSVGWGFEKFFAARAVSRLEGISGILNLIVVNRDLHAAEAPQH